nr:MAG TPA: hypothetical protein [Caudoviricetes sp.]
MFYNIKMVLKKDTIPFVVSKKDTYLCIVVNQQSG